MAWAYLFIESARMGEMAMAEIAPWSLVHFGMILLMWTIMMAAMMLPSALPMILLFTAVSRKAVSDRLTIAPVGILVAGYLTIWTAFCVGATGMQWALEQQALLSPLMVATSPILGGLLLIAAGAYQWTNLKAVCLKHCQAPAEYLSEHWQKGVWGAYRMGLKHGLYCLGCCWVLMGLLFVGGVMNLLWIAAIAAFVLLEKTAPFGLKLGKITGIALIGLGLGVIVGGAL